MSEEKELAESLADHYDSTDTADEIHDATWEAAVVPDPMVTTSLRLPKSVLDRLRAVAAEDGVKPTALIRTLVEAGIALEERDASALSDSASVAARTIVDYTRRAAEELIERVRQEVYEMHRTAVTDAALIAAQHQATGEADLSGGARDVIAQASEAADAILGEARAEAARLRADAERDVEAMARRRDAIRDQLRDVRELLSPLVSSPTVGGHGPRRAG